MGTGCSKSNVDIVLVSAATSSNANETLHKQLQQQNEELEELKIRVREYQEKFEEQKSELEIIFEIDEIRDQHPEPRDMFSEVTKLLLSKFQALFCLLYIEDSETGELDLWGSSTRHGTITQSVAQRVKAKELHTWIDSTYETLTRTKEDAIITIARGVSPPQFLNIRFPVSQTQSISVLCIQIVMNNKPMGCVVLARELTFSNLDIVTLKAAESQIDSAIVQAQNWIQMELRNKELEGIYLVDKIRDEQHELDEFLDLTIAKLGSLMQAEATFVLLYDHHAKVLKLQAVNMSQVWEDAIKEELLSHGYESLKSSGMYWNNDFTTGNFKAIMCIPLILRDQIIGVFGCVNIHNTRKFLSADRRLLHAISSQMDNAIFDNLEAFRLRQVLGRRIDKKVMQRILQNPKLEILKPEKVIATVLYADMRGSTYLAEHTDTVLLASYINDWLGKMTQIIIDNNGTLDKFIGDEVMALFNVPFAQDNHALQAIRVAFKLQETHQKLMKKYKSMGIETTPIGVGIATGELVVGELGCNLRTEYTCIGRAANLGARICDHCNGGSVWISNESYELVKSSVIATKMSLDLKGIGKSVCVWNVDHILDDSST